MKSEGAIVSKAVEHDRLDPQMSKIALQIVELVKKESVTLLGNAEYYRSKLAEKAATKKDAASV